MIYILKGSRSTRAAFDRAGSEIERQQIEAREYKKEIKIDYDTPVTKQEYIGLLKDAQVRTKDSQLAGVLQKEINHAKKHGTNSGLKKD